MMITNFYDIEIGNTLPEPAMSPKDNTNYPQLLLQPTFGRLLSANLLRDHFPIHNIWLFCHASEY